MLYTLLYIITGIVLLAFAIIKKNYTASGLMCAFLIYFGAVFVYETVGYALVVGTFVIINALDFIKMSKRKKVNDDFFQNAELRSGVDILSRYGMALIACMLGYGFNNLAYKYVFFVCMSLGFANAVATKVGTLLNLETYKIFKKQTVPAGTPGGISLFGTLSGVIAAALFANICVFLTTTFLQSILCMAFAIVGLFVDSIFGTFLQEKFKCPVCGIVTEKHSHCEQDTVYDSGIRGFDDNSVKFSVSFVMCALAYLLFNFVQFA